MYWRGGGCNTTADEVLFTNKLTKLAVFCLISIVPLLKPTILYATTPTEISPIQIIEAPPLIALTANPQVVQELYEQQQAELAKQKALTIRKAPAKAPLPYNVCSCVSYAKWLSGINVGSIGIASNHPVNSSTPTVGGLVVFKGNPGHLAVVIAVEGNLVTIKEANYQHCVAGTTRVIDLGTDYVDIKGFYNE